MADLAVLQVAIKTPDDVVHTMPRPARHGEIINRLWTFYPAPEGRSASDFGEHGFLLSDGSFADRVSAWAVAHHAGQILPTARGREVKHLFSEDCW